MRIFSSCLLWGALLISAGCVAQSTGPEQDRVSTAMSVMRTAMVAVRTGKTSVDMSQSLGIQLETGPGDTALGEKGGVRLVLFGGSGDPLHRVDLYFELATAPGRSEIEELTGPLEVFRRSKDSSAKGSVAVTPPQRPVRLFATLWGASPGANTPLKSLSIRLSQID